MSSKHVSPSMTTCFRYESSIVGVRLVDKVILMMMMHMMLMMMMQMMIMMLMIMMLMIMMLMMMMHMMMMGEITIVLPSFIKLCRKLCSRPKKDRNCCSSLGAGATFFSTFNRIPAVPNLFRTSSKFFLSFSGYENIINVGDHVLQSLK